MTFALCSYSRYTGSSSPSGHSQVILDRAVVSKAILTQPSIGSRPSIKNLNCPRPNQSLMKGLMAAFLLLVIGPMTVLTHNRRSFIGYHGWICRLVKPPVALCVCLSLDTGECVSAGIWPKTSGQARRMAPLWKSSWWAKRQTLRLDLRHVDKKRGQALRAAGSCF